MTNHLADVVAGQMREHRIPGLSLATLVDGTIAQAQGYGFTDRTEKSPILATTLFQAASISKCLTALAALRLVDQGRLALDREVNADLRAWKIPLNELTRKEPVTLRRLLSHNAGMTVHGFPGYVAGQPIPTLHQILNGTPPANTPAIRVTGIPGGPTRYSGGGYTVLQELLIGVTRRPFPELMDALVLQPLAMTASTFEQPLSQPRAARAATGHAQAGEAVVGGAHLYPEMAAAGLWTTAADLARYVIGVRQSLTGQAGAILSAGLTREMLTPQSGECGLGPQVAGAGPGLRFFHSGRNAGFEAVLMAQAETGTGAIIMINANANPKGLNSILKAGLKGLHGSSG